MKRHDLHMLRKWDSQESKQGTKMLIRCPYKTQSPCFEILIFLSRDLATMRIEGIERAREGVCLSCKYVWLDATMSICDRLETLSKHENEFTIIR